MAKAITYRVAGTVITCAAAYCLTGSVGISLVLAPIDLVAKTILYYAHERVWNATKWGINQPDGKP